MAVIYRNAEPADAPALSQLAHRALQPHALPGWTDHAIQRLLDENSESALRAFLPNAAFVHVCVESDSIVGFIGNKLPRLVSLLVVDPIRQRRGVGSRLLTSMFDFVTAHAPEVSVVEVNATEYSLPFYGRTGSIRSADSSTTRAAGLRDSAIGARIRCCGNELLLGRADIEAVRFTENPEPDLIGIHPDHLDY